MLFAKRSQCFSICCFCFRLWWQVVRANWVNGRVNCVDLLNYWSKNKRLNHKRKGSQENAEAERERVRVWESGKKVFRAWLWQCINTSSNDGVTGHDFHVMHQSSDSPSLPLQLILGYERIKHWYKDIVVEYSHLYDIKVAEGKEEKMWLNMLLVKLLLSARPAFFPSLMNFYG